MNSRFKQNTNGVVTVSGISSMIFQKVRMAAFVHSFLTLSGLGRLETFTCWFSTTCLSVQIQEAVVKTFK